MNTTWWHRFSAPTGAGVGDFQGPGLAGIYQNFRIVTSNLLGTTFLLFLEC